MLSGRALRPQKCIILAKLAIFVIMCNVRTVKFIYRNVPVVLSGPQHHRWKFRMIRGIGISLALQCHSLMVSMRTAMAVGGAVGEPAAGVDHYARAGREHITLPSA